MQHCIGLKHMPSSQKCHHTRYAPHAHGSIASGQMRHFLLIWAFKKPKCPFTLKYGGQPPLRAPLSRSTALPAAANRTEQLALLLLPQRIQFAGEQQLRRKGGRERETGRLFITHHSIRKNKLNSERTTQRERERESKCHRWCVRCPPQFNIRKTGLP